MDKDNYINSIDELQISHDFNDETSKLMKEALKNSSKKNFSKRKMAISFASIAVVISIGAFAWHSNNNEIPADSKENLLLAQDAVIDREPENSEISINSARQGITIPKIKLPDSKVGALADMIGLFVYNGKVYTQSSTSFETDSEFRLNKDEVLKLRGDYLGKTKGNIDEWSKQDAYATEFASTIGESDVYTLKGYDSSYRLMVYGEYPDGFSAEIYDSFGGLTVNSGADYFDLLKLKGNVSSMKLEGYDSWNNGRNERTDISADDTLNKFIDALYLSAPVGDMNDLFTENTDPDSQKFIYLKTNDNLVTQIRLFKDGYVYAQGVGFFKVDKNAFDAFWNTLPISGKTDAAQTSLPAEPADTIIPEESVIKKPDISTSNIEVSLDPVSYPVGTKSITLKINNKSDKEIYYGVDFSIEKKSGEKWETVSGDLMFIAIAKIQNAKTEEDFVVDLSQITPSLDAGIYRIVKNINGEQFYIKFELV